jgi:probable phosphoglycerate mutase
VSGRAAPHRKGTATPRHATCELAGLGGRAQIEPDLVEWNYGDYEGRSSIDIREQRPGWNIFRDGCPSGESPSAIGERIDRLIARLRTMDGDVALFSHGQFGAAFGARWIGLPVFAAQHFEAGAASMSVMSWDRDHPEIPVLALWNAAPGPDLQEVPVL